MISNYEMSQITPGMHIKIVDKWRYPNEERRGAQNWDGGMDEFLGRVLTVSDVGVDSVCAHESNYWCWYAELIDYVVELQTAGDFAASDLPLEALFG